MARQPGNNNVVSRAALACIVAPSVRGVPCNALGDGMTVELDDDTD